MRRLIVVVFLLCAAVVAASDVSGRSVAASSTAVSKAPVHVCWAMHSWLAKYASAQYFAVRSEAARFPHLDVSTMMLGSNVSGPQAQQIAAGMIPQLGNCTVMLGPGWSALAAALSPLVDAPLWIGASETSTTLSEPGTYPHFNRVIPSDEESSVSVVHLLKHFGWTTVNTFCAESSYGKSFISGFAKLAIRAGINVDQQRCYLVTATATEIDSYLIALRDTSSSRVVVAAMDTALMETVIARVRALGLADVLTFVFSENACTSSQTLWLGLPGSFCASFRLNETARSAFEARYWQRTDKAEVEQLFIAAGAGERGPFKFPQQQEPITAYHGFYADAALLALTTLERYYADVAANNSGTIPLSAAKVQPDQNTLEHLLRGGHTVLHGVTGDVRLNSNGDRSSFQATAINVHPDPTAPSGPGVAHTVASISEAGAVQQSQLPYFVGVGKSAVAPTHLAPKALASSPPADRTFVYVSVGIVLAVIIAVALGAGVYVLRRHRRFARLPQDPAQPFATFFVSVSNEEAIRETFGPDTIRSVCQGVEGIVGAAAAAEGCHVARRLDAHFMVVATDPRRALRCIAAVKTAAHSERWANALKSLAVVKPRKPNRLYESQSEFKSSHAASDSVTRTHDTVSSRSDAAAATTINRTSVTVDLSIGLSFAVGEIDRPTGERDPFDFRYTGGVIDTAARLTDLAQRNQVLVDDAAVLLSSDGPYAHAFDEFCELALPPGNAKARSAQRSSDGSCAPTLVHQFDVPGIPRCVVPPPGRKLSTSALSGVGDVGGPEVMKVGALTVALEEAAGTLSARPVAVAALVVPELSLRSTPLAEAHGVLDAIHAAAADEKAVVISAGDGVVVIAANAVGPSVSAAALRVATASRTAIDAIRGSFGFVSCAGIDCGLAGVGKIGGKDTPQCSALTCSAVVHRATVLAQFALKAAGRGNAADDQLLISRCAAARDERNQSGVILASSAAAPDLKLRCVLCAADVVALSLTHPITASIDQCALGVAYCVFRREYTDDEWMYQLSKAEQEDPFTAINEGMLAIAAGDLVGAEAHAVEGKGSVAEVFAAVNSAAGNDRSFKERVAEYAVKNTNTVCCPFSK